MTFIIPPRMRHPRCGTQEGEKIQVRTMKRFAIQFLFVLPLVRPPRSACPQSFDHLVLQQNYGNPIWGWAQPGR